MSFTKSDDDDDDEGAIQSPFTTGGDDVIEVQYAGWYRSKKAGHNKLVRINNYSMIIEIK